ncbi:MAG TPA: dienelactone hydrolase family protein [Spirochaetia bacterium]|nr:dienelactone hydrolase family protein [Spirochaetia bacterium]
MGLKSEWVRYGSQSGYFAMPEMAALPLPSVIVIQEIWGVESHIEDVTNRIAAAGYAALAPDLYAQNGERVSALTKKRIIEFQEFMMTLPPTAWRDQAAREEALAKLPAAERGRVSETFSSLFGMSPEQRESYVTPLRDAVRYLRHERAETSEQPTACVGFCMGGGLSALLACEEPELAGAAVFYGNTPDPEKVAKIRCPVLAFYGATDARVNAGIPAFEQGMQKIGGDFQHQVYEGAGHSFFNDQRNTYNVRAARDSFARLLAFLARVSTGS